VAQLRFKLVTSRTEVRSVNAYSRILGPSMSMEAYLDVICKDVVPPSNTIFTPVLKEICQMVAKLSKTKQTHVIKLNVQKPVQKWQFIPMNMFPILHVSVICETVSCVQKVTFISEHIYTW
jgi:hypothetical protein